MLKRGVSTFLIGKLLLSVEILMSYSPHTLFYITIFCVTLVHYSVFINSHISFRSYTLQCLMTPSSVCLSPNVIPSQHIKYLRTLLSCPLKDHNFHHKLWIYKYSLFQKSRSMHGYTECRKFSTKPAICMYILWKLMYCLTQCFLVTYERWMFVQMVKK